MRRPSLLRSALKRTLPHRVVQAVRLARWHGRALLGREPQSEHRRLWRETAGRVVAGPFAGMPYIRHSQASGWVPKLLGTYELELWDAVERLVERRPERVINVGAGEGYYAVGLARRLPRARVLAFEAEEEDHDLLWALIDRSDARAQVEVKGLCAVDDLHDALAVPGRALVVCDVEGFEDELLDLRGAPGLASADLLVEVHDHERPGVGDRLRARFAETHSVETIPARERGPADVPAGVALSSGDPLAWLNEGRAPGMYWLLFLPLAPPE